MNTEPNDDGRKKRHSQIKRYRHRTPGVALARLTINIPDHEKARFETMARQKGITVSAVVTESAIRGINPIAVPCSDLPIKDIVVELWNETELPFFIQNLLVSDRNAQVISVREKVLTLRTSNLFFLVSCHKSIASLNVLFDQVVVPEELNAP